MMNKKLIIMLAACLIGMQAMAMKRSGDMARLAMNAFNRALKKPKIDSLCDVVNHKATLGKDYKDVLRTCITSGADVNEKDKLGYPVVFEIMDDESLKANEKYEFLRLLKQHGLDLEGQSWSGMTLLNHCAQFGTHEDVQEVISLGANVNTKDHWTYSTPLHFASKRVKRASDKEEKNTARKMVETLVKTGAKIDAQDNYGRTALHYGGSDKPTSDLLVCAGARCDIIDNLGKTPVQLNGEKNTTLKNPREEIIMPAFVNKRGNPFKALTEREHNGTSLSRQMLS